MLRRWFFRERPMVEKEIIVGSWAMVGRGAMVTA
jgi:hypothetical protein